MFYTDWCENTCDGEHFGTLKKVILLQNALTTTEHYMYSVCIISGYHNGLKTLSGT